MSLVTAYVIYNGTSGTYVGSQNATIQINCDRLRAYSPRPCWLLRRLMPGDGTQIQYLLTFDANDPEFDSNTIQGYFIENDGQDTMIDIVSWQAFVDACNCPDCTDPTGNPVARYYTSGIWLFVPPVAVTYCVTRTPDTGSGYDHDKFVMDYTGRYIGNVRLVSSNGTTSKYQFDAFGGTPQPVGTDVIVAGAC